MPEREENGRQQLPKEGEPTWPPPLCQHYSLKIIKTSLTRYPRPRRKHLREARMTHSSLYLSSVTDGGGLSLHDARIMRALHILAELLERADARESKEAMVTVDELNMVIFGFAALVHSRERG
jgi:hypothetical protein